MNVTIEPITGRYMRLDIHDRPHRLYWEEAGSGIPLLCLHTAGSDGRQFRALLNDPAITSRFRVIVFDMPWHGKSSPPEGWETEEYKLTTDAYVELITTVSQAMNLDRPVAPLALLGDGHRDDVEVDAAIVVGVEREHFVDLLGVFLAIRLLA